MQVTFCKLSVDFYPFHEAGKLLGRNVGGDVYVWFPTLFVDSITGHSCRINQTGGICNNS